MEPVKAANSGEQTEECIFSTAECSDYLLPVRDALDILGSKWKIPIIVALMFGPNRFNELKSKISGISAKMLSKELKDLEINKLVKRTVYDTTPVTVEYTLTSYGQKLEKVIEELKAWGEQHRLMIMGNNKTG